MSDFLDFLDEDSSSNSELEYWTILVVDDDADVHRSTKFAFTNTKILGKSVKFIDAFTGDEAKNIVRDRTDIDLMLLDAVMESETSGLECATYVKKILNRNIPIIIMRSGFAGWEVEFSKHKIDVLDDFLMKTAAPKNVLVQKVEEWLSKIDTNNK